MSLALGLFSSEARAQVQAPDSLRSGAIIGVVWDSTRSAPLADANVVLLNTTYEGTTNADGRFFIPNLPPGSYQLTFVHQRLDSLSLAVSAIDVAVEAGRRTEVRLILPPPPVSAALTGEEVDSVAKVLANLGLTIDASLRSRIRAGAGETADLHLAVIERADQRGIAGALIKLDGTRFSAIADSRGRALFRDVPARNYALRVEMLGYAAVRQQLEVGPGQRLDVRVALSPQAIRLNPLVVEARSRTLDNAGFYERKNDRALWGRFFTAADLERKNLLDLQTLFHSIPGALVQFEGLGKQRVVFRRGKGKNPYCEPTIVIDGQPILNGFELITPMMIAGMEVYVGSQAPIEFGGGCGVILVWTKRGGWSLTRLHRRASAVYRVNGKNDSVACSSTS